jgi:hypothetical protein
MSEKTIILSEFPSVKALYAAAKQVRDSDYNDFDVFSPFPIHGMDDAMGLAPTKLPWLTFIGGAIGLLSGLGLQSWVATTAYPLVISGKPLFSYQAFIPITFELMVLFAAFFTVFGMFALNKLPQHYHPLFKSENFTSVTTDGFFLAIESTNPSEVSVFLKKIGGENIELITDN